MQTAFPPLDNRAPAQKQVSTAPVNPFAEEPRTAGPRARPYVPEVDKISFSHALDEVGAAAAPTDTGPSFGDFIDMINPLQHIPLVNLIYRNLTGDEIGGAAQIVGGAIFGGPIGAVAGTASAIIEYETGQSPAKAAISAFTGEQFPTPARTYADLNAPVTKTYNFNRTA